ncbi:uncharacterized protein [Blastocystis hominis]|uniref:CCT-beta n=1 Tax=Blastocystis hominis TaxID=12968 RepID=D8M3Z4_BLAHO|nr:uncharacterized protein [Blastocystis hominis]CBK22783.2 unnamed protein product [Blastocystis hominis]|eukprot:XP_012896831.1 uncharacterized protein [Blastocystis hominis]
MGRVCEVARLAVDAVLRIRESGNLDYIQILQKPGGSLQDSFLEEGFLLEKSFGVGQKHEWVHPKILVANTSMDSDKIKINSTRVRVDSIAKVGEIEEAEKAKMRAKVNRILAHGMDVFISRQLIYNYPEQLLTDAGKGSIEHADFEGVERLAAVLGADIVSTFDSPESVRLGECEKIEEVMIGEDKVLRFSGCKGGAACTIVLRGASSHLLEEAERSLHDALAILQQTLRHPERTLGGGCAEMAMAEAVDRLEPQVSGKKALAVAAFARALRQIPTILANNAGLDGVELTAQLRAAHHGGAKNAGLDIEGRGIGDMEALGIYESLQLKRQVLLSATEAAEMIVRVDEVIKSAPRERMPDAGRH